MNGSFNTTLSLAVIPFSNRPPTKTTMPGGALNANYQQVDSLANIACQLGSLGFVYGKDWRWVEFGVRVDNESINHQQTVIIEFTNETNKKYALMMLDESK